MIRVPRINLDAVLLTERPFRWEQILHQLSLNPPMHDLADLPNDALSTLRQGLESNGASLHELQKIISTYPIEFGFSVLLCTIRFPDVYSKELMDSILIAIKQFRSYIMDYCIEQFNGGRKLQKTDENIVGEALTLLFSTFDDYVATPQSGNLNAIKYIKNHYPNSVFYSDTHAFTPLHGVCSVLNRNLFEYFIMWHLERKPHGRGGLYEMNDSGITAMDTLIDTEQDITPTLTWLRRRGLLTSLDIEKWLLIHRAAHSSSICTIKFFLDLFPSGTLEEDCDGNLPIHLHLGLRYRRAHTFSDRDFEIVRLLVIHSISYGGIHNIGGLFHQDPEDEKSCTLEMLLKEAGEENTEKVWEMVRFCLNEAGIYSNAPIVHAAILNRRCMSGLLFKEILKRFGASNRNDFGDLPLTYSARIGMKWDKGVADILEANQDAANEMDNETNLPFFLFAASEKADLSTIYHLALQALDVLTTEH